MSADDEVEQALSSPLLEQLDRVAADAGVKLSTLMRVLVALVDADVASGVHPVNLSGDIPEMLGRSGKRLGESTVRRHKKTLDEDLGIVKIIGQVHDEQLGWREGTDIKIDLNKPIEIEVGLLVALLRALDGGDRD